MSPLRPHGTCGMDLKLRNIEVAGVCLSSNFNTLTLDQQNRTMSLIDFIDSDVMENPQLVHAILEFEKSHY